MLTTLPGKRDNVGFFNTDLIFDVLDDEKPVGSLVYDKKQMRATITIGARSYRMERAEDRPDETLYRQLVRMFQGGEKPPPNPWALKDESGAILALGAQTKATFHVTHGADSFQLRPKRRLFQLYRDGIDQLIGTVGQEKFFTRAMHMRLPPEFDPAFQVYLLSLVLTYTLQEMDKATS